VLLLVPAVVQAQAMRWPEAVAALAAERTRAETCGRLLKRHAGNNAAALSRGELAYAEAKAEMDAVIRRSLNLYQFVGGQSGQNTRQIHPS
jgi:hypothetical protein